MNARFDCLLFKLVLHRLFLAVLHFNENGKRLQAENCRGEKIFGVSFPRGSALDGVVKAVKVPQTFRKFFVQLC